MNFSNNPPHNLKKKYLSFKTKYCISGNLPGFTPSAYKLPPKKM